MKIQAIEAKKDGPEDHPSPKIISPEKLIDNLMNNSNHHCFIIFQIWNYNEETAMDPNVDNYFGYDYETEREIITYTKDVLDLLKKKYCTIYQYQSI